MVIKIELKTKTINNKLSKYIQIKQLMKKAFPKNEQIPMWLLNLWTLSKSVHFLAYYDNETFFVV